MSPRQKFVLASHRGLEVALVLLDTVCAWYFLATPTTVFRQSPTWDGVLNLTGGLQWLGWLFLLVAAGAWIGVLGVPWAARVSFALAALPWGAVATSFVYAAWTLNNLGVMTAALTVLAVLLHLASVGHYAPGSRP